MYLLIAFIRTACPNYMWVKKNRGNKMKYININNCLISNQYIVYKISFEIKGFFNDKILYNYENTFQNEGTSSF